MTKFFFYQVYTWMPFLYFQYIQSNSDDFSRKSNIFAIKMTNIFNQTNVENFKLLSFKVITL